MHRHSLVWLAIFIVIALMFLQLPQMTAKQHTVLSTYGPLVEVDALAKQKYVERIDGDRLVDGAIRGLLRQLDPYSGYIAESQLAAFKRRSDGEYIGIGIEVGMEAGRLTIIAPVEGSPAARAGILAGDVILAVDGHEIKDQSAFDVEELLGGRPGTTVRLRVRHPGAEEPTAMTVARGPVSLVTVRGFRRDKMGRWMYMIDPDHRIGYIRVSNFMNNTMRAFEEALQTLLAERVRGLIIDLRFDPGGVMPQAIAMVDRFVDQGVILSTVTRRKAVREYLATQVDTHRGIELAVLINGASASAAEIVAGSLQALDRAVLVGERSFGKGSVQELIHLSEHHAAIKLTTAYYRLPDGRIIHRARKGTDSGEWGVTPDIEIVLDQDEVHAIQASRRALDAACGDSRSTDETCEGAAANVATGDSQSQEIIIDRQLRGALEHLRRRLD